MRGGSEGRGGGGGGEGRKVREGVGGGGVRGGRVREGVGGGGEGRKSEGMVGEGEWGE